MTPLLQLNDIEDLRSVKSPEKLLDARDGLIYHYTDNIKLSVNVALATGRPLLIFGPPGTGKSSLAFNLARKLERKYYEIVINSGSEANDLLYKHDPVLRLSDAMIKQTAKAVSEKMLNSYDYITPGPLWWVIDPDSAVRRGSPAGTQLLYSTPKDPALWIPEKNNGSVLLIDEIDKANPEFPNDLLVPFGSLQFQVPEINLVVNTSPDSQEEDLPLIIFTSNGERKLPAAFIRRCIVLHISYPDKEKLIDIALRRYHGKDGESDTKIKEIYEGIYQAMNLTLDKDEINPAEFLDAVKAVELLGASGEDLIKIINSTSFKEKAAGL